MTAGDLTNLSDVKQYMGITSSASDAKLQQIISAVSLSVKQYCNRDFVKTDYVEVYDGTGTRQLLVNQYPIISVSQVLLAPDNIDITSQVINDGRRRLTLKIPAPNAPNIGAWTVSRFPRDLMNVQVSYSAGYETIPYNLALAVVRIVQWTFIESQRPQQNSKGVGPEHISYSVLAMPTWAQDALNQCRRVV